MSSVLVTASARRRGVQVLLAVAALLLGGFLALALGVGSAGPLYVAGHHLVREIAEQRSDGLVTAMRAITTIGDSQVFTPLIAVIGLALAYRRRDLAPLVALAVSLGGAAALSFTVKLLVARARPPAAVAVYFESTYAFPSGHAIRTVAACMMLAALLAAGCAHTSARVAHWVGASALSLGVGVSRIILGVHWPTDVLGGWLLGTAWALLCIAAACAIARRQQARFPGRLRWSTGTGSTMQVL